MNREIGSYSEAVGASTHHVGEQPRKSMFKKNKRFNSDRELNNLEKDRYSYKRAANKNWTREQVLN